MIPDQIDDELHIRRPCFVGNADGTGFVSPCFVSVPNVSFRPRNIAAILGGLRRLPDQNYAVAPRWDKPNIVAKTMVGKEGLEPSKPYGG